MKSCMIRVVIFALLAVQYVCSYCDEGWIENKGLCYSFSEESVTWFNAASACDLYSGRLVQIESQEKNDWIAAQMVERHIDDSWLGGTCRYHPLTWEWIPSHKPIKTYLNWAQGEPNNPQGEQCLQISKNQQYKWNDYKCSGSVKFICEKRATPRPPVYPNA